MPRVALITTIPASLSFFRGFPAAVREGGYEVVAVSSPGPELDAFGRSQGVATAGVPMSRQITPPRDVVAVVRLAVTLARLRATIVHASTPKGGLIGMLAARLARRPVRVFHLHGLPHQTRTGLRRALISGSTRVACTLADRVICVGASVRDEAVREGIVRRDKTVILANGSASGVDPVRFDPSRFGPDPRRAAREQLGLAPDGLVAGYVGRLANDKGIAELAAAWATLREQVPGARLLVAGGEDADDPVGPEVLAALQADDRVAMIGSTDDPARAMVAMDVLALPTYREGFGLVLIEAGAMGVPVVATAVTGCVDAVVDGETGTLVPVHDAPALAAAIRRYLDDPDLRARHGGAGRERALRDFRPADIHAAMVRLYDELLAAR